jgi:hypothetical protein
MKPLSGFAGLVLAVLGGYVLMTHARPDAFHVALAVFGAGGGAAFFIIRLASNKHITWLNIASGVAAGMSVSFAHGFWAAFGWMLLGITLADIGGCLLGYAFRRTAAPQQPGP